MENQGTGSIVVVDDSASVRQYLSAVLATEGHTCRSFMDAPSVLSYLSTAQSDAALIISDIAMPGMNGMELLRSVREDRPQIPFILLSMLRGIDCARGAAYRRERLSAETGQSAGNYEAGE